MNIEYYVESYRQWLEILGYSKGVAYYNPRIIRDFLKWMSDRQISSINQIDKQGIEDYFVDLKVRKHQRKNGTVSNVYVNGQLGMISNFNKYLKEVHNIVLPIEVERLPLHEKPKIILSREDIRSLYASTDESAFGLRDRAMLGVYYGCGLRRSEGEGLNREDIDFKEHRLLVRKSKNGKQRFVPFCENVKSDLMSYLKDGRPFFDKGKEAQAYFLSRRGNRISGSKLYDSFKRLLDRSSIDKPAGLHALRHSIATHLLESGMKLHYISQFLGHSSLISTQVYTHIVSES